MTTHPAHGAKPHLLWLPVDRLSVDHSYQRTLESRRSQRVIESIAANFQWVAFQAILATPTPDGGWLIIDGQHRVEGARRSGVTEVPAVVVDAATVEAQADAFVRANTERVSMNAFALHRARVKAGEPKSAAAEELCRKAGVTIPAYPIPSASLKPGQTMALGTIVRMAKMTPAELPVMALTTVAEANRDRSGALRASVIQAVVNILAAQMEPDRESKARAIGAWLRAMQPATIAVRSLERARRTEITELAATMMVIREGAFGEKAQDLGHTRGAFSQRVERMVG